MLFKQFPVYRPRAVYADLLEWHRQTMAGSGKRVPRLDDADFDLLIASAELSGMLACADQEEAVGLKERIEQFIDAYRCKPRDDHPDIYREQFLELTDQHGPGVANTVMNYVSARLEPYNDFLRAELESFARRLGEAVTHILDHLSDELMAVFSRSDDDLTMPCSGCARGIPPDEPRWTVNVHEEVFDTSGSIEVLRAEEVLTFCSACAAERDLRHISVASRPANGQA